MTKFEIKLKYKNKIYKIKDIWKQKFGWDSELEGVTYMYEDGNYSCDCNRSLFIRQQCDNNFIGLDCGDQIQLISIKQLE